MLFELLMLTCVQLQLRTKWFTSKDLFESSSVVLVSIYYQSGVSTSVSQSESTASGASTDDKTATIQYKPVRVLLATTCLHITSNHVVTIKYHMHYRIISNDPI